MSERLDFYQRLRGLRDFKEVLRPESYEDAPDDWHLVITDVKGSTEAIRNGRYRDVNTLGASCITAVLNAVRDVEIPYVFGGDGATLLIPESRLSPVERALKGTQRMSEEMFGLSLRIGAVPLKHVREAGARVEVAKFELSPGNVLAQFRGGGIALAEKLIKNPESPYLWNHDASTTEPDLKGLSCRWQPFSSRRGTMLTLLVVQRSHDQSAAEVYQTVIGHVESCLGHDLQHANPITMDRARAKWPSTTLMIEARLHSRWYSLPFSLLNTGIRSLISGVLISNDMKMGRFDGAKYKQETELNSDFRKFDDMLRMVVDCTEAQAVEIENLLGQLRARGEIYYGAHRSPQAVMTCMVFDASDNKHIHFIDGSHGGYAMAAQMLKSQLISESL